MRALTDDSADAATLVSAIDVLDARRDFAILEHVFQRLHELADPRVADALAKNADHAGPSALSNGGRAAPRGAR